MLVYMTLYELINLYQVPGSSLFVSLVIHHSLACLPVASLWSIKLIASCNLISNKITGPGLTLFLHTLVGAQNTRCVTDFVGVPFILFYIITYQ